MSGVTQPLSLEVADEVVDQMADSIVALTHELEEANARIAVLEVEQGIFVRANEKLREQVAAYRAEEINQSCREKEAADRGVAPWGNI